ncbi:premelanosome protein a [Melanotaenia boesemani]|uniref:premelanosome protein a n=1 Tax=Melanotaenia boesemani TaxID=1250792 RepID=UPI001C042EB8|nr:premelanosome protein a [Melanotaenia boesemani]
MKTVVLLALVFTSAVAIRQRSKFTRYRSWNSRMYPVWQDGDPRFRNCWNGGEVTFDLKNDAPTLTGAKATFTINLNFPPNQTVLPDGQVVWAQNCTINGRQYQEGEAVYPDQDNEWTGVFPDGTPFTRSQNKKPHYVFVWKTWGRYWQVADGPSSSLTIGTDNVPLGSYNMEVVIYHTRGRDRFIPLGYASTVFAITDQVPFRVSLAQINDVNQADQNFIQNQAIAFTVTLHDPSQYLNSADVSLNWDFGDNSGTLISRERTVTHTYLSVGTFKPQVVLMASIPNGCGNPTAVVPMDASAAPAVVVMASTPAAAPAEGEDTIALDVPASDATPVAVSVQPADAAMNTDDGEPVVDTEVVEVASVAPAAVDAAVVPAEQDPANTAAPAAEVNAAAEETDATVAEVATVDPVAPAAEEVADVEAAAENDTSVVAETDAAAENVPVIDATAAAAPVGEGEEATVEVAETVTVAAVVDAAAEGEAAVTAVAVEPAEAAVAAIEVVQAETQAPVDNVVALAATEATAVEEAAPVDAAADTEAEVLETENVVAATAAAAGEVEVVPAEGEVQTEVEADPAQVALVVAKRQAPELTADCTIYRYGSIATSVEIVQGIESVEIVQVSNVVAMATELEQNAVDVTISCQGSLPSEVCTVISDADCISPVQTVCTAATPSPDCQMILRQFFNETGVFCLNVSLTNDVSLAVASARVNVAVASGGSPAGTAATVLGVMVLACVVCCVGLMYRRFKQYQPLREDGAADNGGSFAVTSVPLLLWNLLSRQSPGESRPLLQGRIV